MSRSNRYVVTYNSWIVSDYALALRLLVEHKSRKNEPVDKKLIRRWFQVARWSNRLSLLLPPERPRALSELAFTYAYLNKLKKSLKLVDMSCRKGTAMKSEYELAKSNFAKGLFSKQQGAVDGEVQMALARETIDRIEQSTTSGTSRAQ